MSDCNDYGRSVSVLRGQALVTNCHNHSSPERDAQHVLAGVGVSCSGGELFGENPRDQRFLGGAEAAYLSSGKSVHLLFRAVLQVRG